MMTHLRRLASAGAIVVLLVLAGAGAALAAPTISITSPTPGQPLYNIQPTIRINYSSSGAPLDLTSLAIQVNGINWTSRFTVGPSSATYSVSAADALVAGRITISAQIRDQGTPPASAAASQGYDLFPTFQALTPGIGSPGDTITLRGLGLDPVPGHNQAVFPNAFGPALTVPFGLVRPVPGDPVAKEGTVVVPQGTASGYVRLVVNGNEAQDRRLFQIQPPVTNCGSVRGPLWSGSFRQLADGSFLVWFATYLGGYGGIGGHAPWVDTRCPQLPDPDTCCPGTCFWHGAVTRIATTGDVQVLRQDLRYCPVPGDFSEFIQAIAVDKAGIKAAILTSTKQPWTQDFQLGIRYNGRETRPLGVPWADSADFDPQGNLYLVGRDANQVRVWQLTRQQLAAGGDVTPRLVASGLGLTDPRGASFVVSCDGYGYLAVLLYRSGDPPYDSVLLKLDLQTGAVLDARTFDQQTIRSLSLSCHTHELWGLMEAATRVDLWRAETSSDPHDIGSLQVQRTWPVDRHEDFFPAIGILSNGNVQVAYDPLAYRGLGLTPGIFTVPGLQVTPCTSGGVTSALPLCATGLTLRPETTRWRPQRSSTGAVEVHFSGPRGLTPATTLEITGPEGGLTGQSLAFEVVDGTTDPARYKIIWSGPWMRNTPAEYLPRGDYRVRVLGVASDGSPVTSSSTDANGIVSLVEVIGVELCQADEAEPCLPLTTPYSGVSADNPPVGALPDQDPPQDRDGGGKRIFAEAVIPSGTVLDMVKVRATTAPRIPPDPARSESSLVVLVHFRSLDVDDPALYPPDADGDSGPVLDNRGTPKEGIVTVPTATVAPGATTTRTYFRASGPAAGQAGGQPGDNYRIMASTSQPWLQGIQAVQGSRTGALNLTAEESVTASTMLTVWRTLHVEIDSMGPAPAIGSNNYAERNFILGKLTHIDEIQLAGSEQLPTRLVLEPETTTPLPLADGSRDLSGIGLRLGCGRFEKGSIRIGSGAGALPYAGLDGNGADFVRKQGSEPCPGDKSVGFRLPFALVDSTGGNPLGGNVLEWSAPDRRFVLSRSVPSSVYDGGRLTLAGITWTVASTAGSQVTVVEDQPFPFHLLDDDDAVDLTINTNQLQPSEGPEENALAQAYIRPRYDVTNPRPQPSFNRNISRRGPDGQPDSREFIDQIGRGRDSAVSTAGYWVMYAQGAFQGDELIDLDPQSEFLSAYGETLFVVGREDAYGSTVYREIIRDNWFRGDDLTARCSAAVLVHEFGHQFGLDHTGGRMGPGSCISGPFYFTGDQLAKIRGKGVQ